MARSGYTIVDEPRPSPLQHLAVEPFWIFLTTMLGGTLVGWLWFAFNGFAIGSASKARELAILGLGVLGSAAYLFGLGYVAGAELVPSASLPYLWLLLTGFQITIAYYLHVMQSRSFELYQYFGGAPKNGLIILIAATLLRPTLANLLGPWSGVLL